MLAARAEVLVHFGAGSLESLDSILHQANRAVLVEARSTAFEALAAHADGHDAVDVRHAAIDAHGSEERPFFVYNLAGASGLHEPASLKTLAPGLRVEKQFGVKCFAAGDFLSQSIAPGETAILVLDVNGEEAAIIEALTGTAILDQIVQLRVHCGARPLYRDALAAAEIETLLRDAGFEQVGMTGAGARRIVTGRKPGRSRLQQLAKWHAEQLEVTKGKLEDARSQHEALKAEAEQAAEQLRLTEEELEQAKARLSALEAKVEDLESDAKNWQAAHEKTGADLAAAVRRQAMAQADLAELQARYQAMLAIKHSQDELLAKLVSRLEDAARYLADLPGGQADAGTGELIEARPAKRSSRARKPGKRKAT